MKKTVFLVLFLFGMIGTSSAHRIVEISRHNGLFGFYSYVDQQFLGYFSNGVEWWSLVCHSPGFVSCRIRATGGKAGRDKEIEEIENTKLSDLMLAIENDEISQGHLNGETNKHYLATLSDGTTADIVINLSWAPDPNDVNASKFHAEISHD